MLRGPVVVDTDVFSARLIANSLLAHRYEPLLAGRGEIISFQTVAELIDVYAQLRVACTRAGHALHQRQHDADRWIAATALRLGIPLVSNDHVFQNAPGLTLETLPS